MKVWVTRDESADGPLSKALGEARLEPVLEPVIERRVLDDARDAIARLRPDDWLVLTSAYAIEAVAIGDGCAARVAVVAEASRRAALKRGLRVELVSPDGTGAGLFRTLGERARGARVLYPRSSLAAVPDMPADVTIESLVLYETAPREWRRGVIDEVDVVAVASPSAVRAVGAVGLPFASIGAVTSAALRGLGIEPWVEAREPSFGGLAEAIARAGGR
jgi:uroporphyrinogen-III synthase